VSLPLKINRENLLDRQARIDRLQDPQILQAGWLGFGAVPQIRWRVSALGEP
jgi:hypothetical protein